jgi:uncharacterized membrane protein
VAGRGVDDVKRIVDDVLVTTEPETRVFGPAWARLRLLVVQRAMALRSLSAAERVAYGATCLYAAVFTFFAVVRHLAFQSQRGDLGNMTQAIWSTLHGHPLEGTTLSGAQVSRLAVHVDPFLVLIAPLSLVWSCPVMLVTVQALAVSAGALPVFWLARKHLGSQRAAAYFALAYLLFPATQFNAFAVSTGFHSVSIAIPLLLFAIWFLDEDRLVAFAFVAILAATTKEEMPLVVGLLGLWYAMRTGRWRFGLPVLVIGAALTLVDFLVVIPHFLGSQTVFADRYSTVGGSAGGVLHTAATDPLAIVRDVATVHKLIYVALLFGPFLGLWLLEPFLAFALVPDLAINLLSTKPDQTKIVFHYTAGMVPFIIAASIFGLARFRQQAARISLYVLAAVAVTAVYSPMWLGVQHLSEALPSNAVHQAKSRALSMIPPGVPVAASDQLGAHLSQRRRIMDFQFAVREARWIIVDRSDPSYSDEALYRRRIGAVARNPRWRLMYSSHGVLVFHKLPAAR